MAGPAPKQGGRQRRNVPARGEWVDLPELSGPVIPDLPEGDWTQHSIATWLAWQQDPVTAKWGSSEIAFAIETLHLVDRLARRPGAQLAAEIRQRMDSLGLTLKGKRDNRWRVPEGQGAEVHDLPTPEQQKRRVRAVDAAA